MVYYCVCSNIAATNTVCSRSISNDTLCTQKKLKYFSSQGPSVGQHSRARLPVGVGLGTGQEPGPPK